MILFITTLGSQEFPPSGGGSGPSSGTFADRPASPSVGDIYTVTSGAGAGDVYQCTVAGVWTLVAYNRTPNAPAAVARWLLTDTTSTIVDSVGANNLSYSGASTRQGRPSPWGKCLYTGAIGAGDGPKGAATIEPEAVTVSVWMRTYANPVNFQGYVVGKRQAATWSGSSPTNMGIAIYQNTDGTIVAYALCASGGANSGASPSVDRRAALDVWCHLAVSYSAADGLRLYVDGQPQGTAAAVGDIVWGDGVWTIGVNNVGGVVPQAIDAFVRDVQVCDRVLTAAEVLEIYQRGIGTYTGQP